MMREHLNQTRSVIVAVFLDDAEASGFRRGLREKMRHAQRRVHTILVEQPSAVDERRDVSVERMREQSPQNVFCERERHGFLRSLGVGFETQHASVDEPVIDIRCIV